MAKIDKISPKSAQAVVKYFQNRFDYSIRSLESFKLLMIELDKAYMRETDQYKKTANGTSNQALKARGLLESQELPVISPLVESAVTYLDGVFLTGYPIFNIVASREQQEAATAMGAKIGQDQIEFGWVSNLHKGFKDGLKYNLMAFETSWEEQSIYSIEDRKLNESASRRNEALFAGNRIKKMDLYNTIWDPRVLPSKIHEEGEYAGYTERMSRIRIKQFIAELGNRVITSAIKPALESSYRGTMMYDVDLRKDRTMQETDLDWGAWLEGAKPTSSKINYSESYCVSVLYARILPEDFSLDVPAPKTPQVWKFILVNGAHCILAERMSNAHNYLPIVFGQPVDDDLGYATKGFTECLLPFQNTSSTLHNARIASLRRSISDRALYNPRMIRKEDINNPNPAHKIPVTSIGPNQSINSAYYQIPFQDNVSMGYTQEIGQNFNYASQAVGVNAVQQGNFVKGNKTNQQFDETMANANARQESMAICLEDSLFRPIKKMVKLNLFQYGNNAETLAVKEKAIVSIDIAKIRNAGLEFAVSDGLLPGSKLASTDEMAQAFQFISTVPALQQGMDLPGMFVDLMEKRGFAGIRDFKLSAPQVAQQQQSEVDKTRQLAEAEAAAAQGGM